MTYDSHIGALEIGIVASVFLFGITSTQTYLYYQLFPVDPKWTRWMVASVWFLELGHSITAIHALYVYTIHDFGEPKVETMQPPVSMAANFLISEIVFVCVQGYFILRITKISRTWLFTTGCTLLLAARFVVFLFALVETQLMEDLKQYEHDWNWALITMLSIGSFVDLAIPCGLVYFLLIQRSAAYKTTVAIVDKLILWTIETGLATGVLAVLTLVLHLALPGKFAWRAVYMCLPKMFSNALLVNLNSRVKLRAMQENTEVVEMSGNEQNGNSVCFPHRLGARITVSTQRVRTIENGSKEIEVIAPSGEELTSMRDRKDLAIFM
ncbi:hypothetical protein PQX77_015321 [Marasmius sp. AFHP31]|nr:hypothetical protein PQX77_015321 [Marasmius sp. AFHP31]